ncbi:flagellar export chaperone FliS [Aquabacterium sp.]|uniref:flagellar export chaperone FliS n=1 Tax=Aquabacterium sp. TaxID=1872578 RepID=UPI0035C71615
MYVQTPKHLSSAYRQIGLETGVIGASPHQLITMLFDGALECIARAQGAIRDGQLETKLQNIGKSIDIVDQGLRSCLDLQNGGELAANLSDLYAYMSMRLLHANLRNDVDALDEVSKLLTSLRTAWVAITPSQSAAAPSQMELRA